MYETYQKFKTCVVGRTVERPVEEMQRACYPKLRFHSLSVPSDYRFLSRKADRAVRRLAVDGLALVYHVMGNAKEHHLHLELGYAEETLIPEKIPPGGRGSNIRPVDTTSQGALSMHLGLGM